MVTEGHFRSSKVISGYSRSSLVSRGQPSSCYNGQNVKDDPERASLEIISGQLEIYLVS